MPNPRIKHNSWEYPDMDPGKVPMWVRNCADPKKVGQFLEEHKEQLTEIEKEYLTHKRDSLQKLAGKISEVQKQVQEKTYAEQKPELLADAENGIYVLQGIDQPSFQTADNGCWSCFYQMLLQSRGVKDITQEDIRAYRPTLPEGEQFGENTSAEMNSDVRNNMLEMGDLALDLMPDTMIKSVDIVSYHSFKNGVGEDDIEKLTYSSAIENAVKQQIIESVRDHHSPVGLMIDGHYLTITGIEGNTVYYKNSMPPEGDENADPNVTYTANLTELLYPAINGVNADSFTLTWLEDIKLSKKDNILYNTASPNMTVSEDGTVVNGALQDQAVFEDERRQKGIMIGCTGGIDLPEDEAGFRQHLKPGFFKTEKTYLPKKLNMGSLQKKAAERSDEEEKALSDKRDGIIAERDNYRKEIEPLKIRQQNAMLEAPVPQDPRENRFKIPTTYSGKRAFFGNTTSYRAFRGLFAITNHFDLEKDAPLLDAIANLYDIHDLEANPEHKAAMDIVMTNLKAGKEDPDEEDNIDSLSVSTYKSNLKAFYNAVVNGSQVYDSKTGQYIRTKGIGEVKLAEHQQKSLQYIESYIKVLDEIEKIEPTIQGRMFDADSFIDPQGQVNVEGIQNDPVIKDVSEQKNLRRVMQNSIGYGQSGRSIFGGPDMGPYQGGRSLLAGADMNYTGDFGYAADNPKKVIEVLGDFEYYETFVGSLVGRGLPKPKNLGEENVYRAIYNLLTFGGKEYDQLNQYTFLTAKKLDDLILNTVLTRLYDLNFSTPWRKVLGSSVQCITDCLVRREETAFAKLETAYFDGDAKTFAHELVGWERKQLHQQDARGFARYYSNAVHTALDELKKEFASCKAGDERYEFYTQVRKEITAIANGSGMQDSYTYAACEMLNSYVPEIKEPRRKQTAPVKHGIREKQNQQVKQNNPVKQKNRENQSIQNSAGPAFRRPLDMLGPKGEWVTMDQAKQHYKIILEDYHEYSKVRRLSPDRPADLQKAANAIVCSILQTEGAKESFFGHTNSLDEPEEGYIRVNDEKMLRSEDIAACVKAMTEQLLKEPEILKRAMAGAQDAKSLYSEYRNQLRSGMNMQVENAKRAEEAEAAKIKKKGRNIVADDAPKEMVKLSAKDLDYLRRTRKELKDLYMLDGAFRSSYMEKLYNSLDRVINTASQNGRMADKQDLISLKNKSLVYYDKRKGVIMGPVTDKGKARLEIVENLAHRLEKMGNPEPKKKMGK